MIKDILMLIVIIASIVLTIIFENVLLLIPGVIPGLVKSIEIFKYIKKENHNG